jgi:ubiquinone/menaquinone biosynthesis C-methylase UbiE
MEDHIMDSEKAEKLEDESRYRILSREKLLTYIDEGDTIADIGSGTGFFTDDLALKADKVYAVDFQKGMHKFYRDKGVPENVELIHSKASKLEIESVDLIVSILSLHEINLDKSLKTFKQVLAPEGSLLIVDWSKNAATDNIPPREKMYTAEEAREKISNHFKVKKCEERYDTFLISADKK